jgi:hypothetical protein
MVWSMGVKVVSYFGECFVFVRITRLYHAEYRSDQLMSINLSSLIRSVLAIHDLIDSGIALNEEKCLEIRMKDLCNNSV